MEQQVDVVNWHAAPVSGHREQVWSAWLHGSVAAIRHEDRLLLVVPMDTVPPSAAALALRLHQVGAWAEVGPDATTAA